MEAIKTNQNLYKSKFIDRIIGYLMGLPIFLELYSGGVRLPTSHFFMEGIPLHSSMLAILFLITSYKIKIQHVLFVLIFYLRCVY